MPIREIFKSWFIAFHASALTLSYVSSSTNKKHWILRLFLSYILELIIF